MKIRVLGAGWYGCHVALALIKDGHEVEVHEIADRVLAGASGNCPARLHLGALHYPRSGATQNACSVHQSRFMDTYGFLTRPVPTNIYAVAAYDSLVDLAAYRKVLRNASLQFIDIMPAEYGLENVEGAVLTGERHIVADMAAAHFTRELGKHLKLGMPADAGGQWDVTIDATFAANDATGIDRYEPCMTVMLEGPTDRATTIVDGQFAGLYPWNESLHLSSLTSASLTPLSKTCKSYAEAKAMIAAQTVQEASERSEAMLEQMAKYWPAVRDLYRIVDIRMAVRAMPRSGADSRLVDVWKTDDGIIRVRAGKIDAIFDAVWKVEDLMPQFTRIIPL